MRVGRSASVRIWRFIIWEKHCLLQMLYRLKRGAQPVRGGGGPATFKLLTVTQNMSSITNYVFCEYMYIICDDIALFVSAVVPLVSDYCFCFLFCLSLSWLDFWLGSTWLCLSLFRFALWKKSQFLKCSRTRPVFIFKYRSLTTLALVRSSVQECCFQHGCG